MPKNTEALLIGGRHSKSIKQKKVISLFRLKSLSVEWGDLSAEECKVVKRQKRVEEGLLILKGPDGKGITKSEFLIGDFPVRELSLMWRGHAFALSLEREPSSELNK